jgi:hypothetical protein
MTLTNLFRLSLSLLAGSLLPATAQTPLTGHLLNRYSFTADAADSVGGAHGALIKGATISNNAVVLDGVSAYVNLPNNLVTGLTSLSFEAWVTESGGGGWARLWDFGNSINGEDAQGGGTTYLFLAWPAGDGNSLRGCYRPPGEAEMVLDAGPRPTEGVPHHLVWTQDASNHVARIYLDGVPISANENFTFTPAAVGATVNDWLGRSQYDDPYFRGSIDEFRIYDFALPAEVVALNHQLGPDATPLGPLQFVVEPQDQSVDEGGLFTLTSDVTGAPPFTFQWYRNDVPLPGATAANLTATAALADDGASFQLWATNIFTNTVFAAVSRAAVLQVRADTNAPVLLSAMSLGTSGVEVRFSEPLWPDTALVVTNYALAGPGGAIVLSTPVLSGGGQVVSFATAPLTVGDSYTLTVSGLRDQSAATNLIAPGSQVVFIATPAPVRDIGNPTVPGVLRVATNDTLILTGVGAEIGGTSDQCSMTTVSITGNFDQQVRLSGLVAPEMWSKAGLMARATLTGNSPFAAALATPGVMGCYFASRAAAGATAVTSGRAPVNYPYTWLRLRRAGSVFTGYASYDGLTWTTLGSAALPLTNTLYVGVAIASHVAGTPAVVTFSDAGHTLSPTIGVVANPSEPLGPSSRLSPIVISEIMAKPASRTDGRNLEFVEIFNSNPFFHDLSGHRLAGDLKFTFPSNTIIQAGSFLVVAAAPADVQAVYGLSGVFGPYTNSLKTSGTVRLYDEVDRLIYDASYSDAAPWPMGTDGTGHSLVLARPSYGEADPRAWSRSETAGGSPGALEGFLPGPLRNVVLNAVLAHTDPPDEDTIEFYNHGNTAVDLSGCTLSDDPAVAKFAIAAGTTIPARGFLYFTEAQLGFGLSAAGETIYFKNADGSRVLDALKFAAQENGVAFGRWPDGAAEWYRLGPKAWGTNNPSPLVSSVGINEIMYHPISGNDDDQFIELFNRGSNAVSLAGWKLVAGVSYTFASNVVIAPDGYLVVAANTSRLLTNYPQLKASNTVGNFSGRLSGKGERVALARPDTIVATNGAGFPVTNYLDIVVDEVTYGAGGRWGQWADGGGSSLELRDPRADHRLAANWADSDESAKSAWTTIETTGVLDHGANYSTSAIANGQIGLLDGGECLLDDVEVRSSTNAAANYVANPSFVSGLTGWVVQGSFSRSSLAATQGYGGTGAALQLRTGSRFFTLGNSAQCTLTNTGLGNGQTATLRLKARWLRGSPDLVFRLSGNWLEAAGTLPVPANLGTPGQRNTCAVTNAPPAIWAVTHTPSMPAAAETVVVTARVSDPDGVTNCSVLCRVDPATSYTTIAMHDDGLAGDAVAGDGVFSAALPVLGAGGAIAFVVQAKDSWGAVGRFPALVNDNGPARECVVRFGDPEPPGGFGIYHLWLTQSNVTRWLALPIMSNEEMDATLVYRGRVIYNASARYSGSPYHQAVDGPAGTRACHYIWSLPKDDMFLGASAFNKIHWPGNDIQNDTLTANNSDSTLQREQTANAFLRGLGVPWVPRRYVIVYVNGTRRGQLMEDSVRPSGSVPEAYFPDDTGGFLYKIQPWFEGTALPDAKGFIPFQNKGWATVTQYRTTGGVYKAARYRWHYEPREIPGSANDYTNVFTLLDAFSSYNDPDYERIINGVVDVDQWLRVLAANHAAGNWDCYGVQNGQNLFGYVSPQRRWQLFMFDFNIVIGNSIAWAAGANLEKTQETAWEKMYGATGRPVFRRLYWRALKELVNGQLKSTVSDPLLDAKYAAFLASGVTAANPQAIKSWLASARASIASQVASHDAPAFVLPSGTLTTSSNLLALSGIAPLEAESFTVGGKTGVLKWTSLTGWTLLAPVPAGTNALALVAYDRHGNALAGGSNLITVVSTAATEAPEGKVVFSEIMHHARQPDAEYVELFNAATNTAFDLSGWQINGLSYEFPAGTVIPPRDFLVLARSRSIFANTYGASNWVADVFGGNLQSDGETLSLLRPGVAPDAPVVVDRVRYETNAPWPAAANQPGTALQLVDPAQDNSRVGNWATGRTNAAALTPQWVYFWTNLTPVSSSRLYLYLRSAGTLHLDDLKLVAGNVPEVGTNLVRNGDFETTLTNSWSLVGNHKTTALSAAASHSGTNSLRMVATAAGTGLGNSIYQDVTPALTYGSNHTVSFWFLQSTNASSLAVRFSGGTVTSTVPVAAPIATVAALVTPGATNSIAATRPAFPTLWLNELQAENITGPLDNAGQRDPWFELYNSGTNAISLAGLYLGTNAALPTQWTFPATSSIGPGQFLVVWADGQPLQSTGSVLHTSFRLTPGNGSLLLSRFVSNAVQTVDYLNYSALPANYAFGDVPDGQPFYRQPMFRASPAGTNNAALPPVTVFINEWMAENTGFITDPGTGKYDDWFELYNPSDTPAELGGYYLTDTLSDPFMYQIPVGYRVPPRGHLLVWADSKSSANNTNSPDLHVNFKLSKDGEAIGLFTPEGVLLDAVTFATQTANSTEGRYPDGTALRLFMPTPSPRAANILPPATTLPDVCGMTWIPGEAVTLSFLTSPGHSYRVEFKPDLDALTWLPLGGTWFATGTTLTVTDSGASGAQRFYRVVLLD